MKGSTVRVFRILPCLASGVLVAGCYSYVPARLETLDPGASVRMEISPVAADRMESLRFSVAPRVEGIVVGRDGTGLELDALIRTVDAYGTTAVHTQRLSMSVEDVRSVEYRRFDRAKTGLAVGGLGFALVGGLYILFRGDLGSIDVYNPPVDFTSPILRIPLPWPR